MKLFLLNLILLISFVSNAQYCPEHEYNFSFELNEPLYLNQIIGELYSCDPDGDHIEWSISDNDNMWLINDGIISVNNINIDKNFYTFNVKVTDNGFPPLSSQSVVNIYIKRGSNLLNIYPNPFNDILNIDIDIKTESNISIRIINQMGQHIKYITEPSVILPSGKYKYIWNGDNDYHLPTSPGMYYLIVTLNDKIINYYKVIFVK